MTEPRDQGINPHYSGNIKRSNNNSNRIERQYTTYRDLLEPFIYISRDTNSKQSKLYKEYGVFC
jgi:Cdc6-like AAA superfamily ATPase